MDIKIAFLKMRDVSVLVSRQFGRNIKHISRQFIPVIVREESPDKVTEILLKHIRWLVEELDRSPESYKLFIMNQGVLKRTIDQSFKVYHEQE